MNTTVTTKGQVTIPKAVRDLLGIAPGSKVSFTVEGDGRVTLRKQTGRSRPPGRIAHLRGKATVPLSTDRIMAPTRGDI